MTWKSVKEHNLSVEKHQNITLYTLLAMKIYRPSNTVHQIYKLYINTEYSQTLLNQTTKSLKSLKT